MVSPKPMVPLQEIRVEDAAEYLLGLEREGKLLIVRYPEKIAGIPVDDEDLVVRAVVWYRRFGPSVLRELRHYHPHLLERVEKALHAGKYRQDETHL